MREATAKTHVSRVLAKLGVRERIQEVIFAYNSGFATPSDVVGPPRTPDAGG